MTLADLSSCSDAQLVRRVRAGHVHEAWAELDRRYRRRATRLVRRRWGALLSVDADEVAHDALTRAYLTLHRLDEPRPLWPWLCALLRREVRKRVRSSRRRPDPRWLLRAGHEPSA